MGVKVLPPAAEGARSVPPGLSSEATVEELGSLEAYLLEVHGQALWGDLKDPGMRVLEGGQLLPQGLQARAVCGRDASTELRTPPLPATDGELRLREVK